MPTAVKVNLDKQKTSVLTGAALQIMGDVIVVDSTTVQVSMKSPWATFPAALTTQAGVMAAPSQLQATGEDRTLHPIGTGPFVFDTWRRIPSSSVTKNPNYWLKDANGRPAAVSRRRRLQGARRCAVTWRSLRVGERSTRSRRSIRTQIKEYQKKAEQGQYQMYSNQNREEAVQFIGSEHGQAAVRRSTGATDRRVRYSTRRPSRRRSIETLFPVTTGLFPKTSPYYADDELPRVRRRRRPPSSTTSTRQKYGKPLVVHVNLPSTPEFKAIGELAKETGCGKWRRRHLNLTDQSTLIVSAVTGDFEATGFITFGDPNIDQIFFSNDTLKPVGDISLNFTRLRRSMS